jgi:hypothetical protein
VGRGRAADFQGPISAAVGSIGEGNSVAPTAHHVCAMPRRVHPHPPRTFFGFASESHILSNGACRPTMLKKACVVEAVSTGHVRSMLLSESLQPSTIGMTSVNGDDAENYW